MSADGRPLVQVSATDGMSNRQRGTRNPPWQRDELLLALDLYFRLGQRVPDDGEPEVQELSRLLNALPIHSIRPDATLFRNPNGVAMKLANFHALANPGRGLSGGGRLDAVIWEEYGTRPDDLRAIASTIARLSLAGAAPAIGETEEDDQDAFPEGRVCYRLHRSYERRGDAARRKKQQALRQFGCLRCEVCAFDFAATYGSHGEGFIECHHTVPVHRLGPSGTTRFADLALVCANCHRMLHRGGSQLTVEGLRTLVMSADRVRS